MKKQDCNNCGVRREIVVKTELYDQKNTIKDKLNWLCVPCLLVVAGLFDTRKFDYKKAMRECDGQQIDLEQALKELEGENKKFDTYNLELLNKNDKLQAENEKLREVVEAAREAVNCYQTGHTDGNYLEELEQALKELEGE